MPAFLRKIIIFFALLGVASASQNKFLDPEDAFRIKFSQDETRLYIKVRLGDAIVMYKDKLKLKLIKPIKA
ncbi:MAG: thiol:disulfide interchange protein, partial [Deltaproteobacteria bacterium]